MGGRLKMEVIYVEIELIHFVVEQKLTRHCKAIILQKKESAFSFIDSAQLFLCFLLY